MSVIRWIKKAYDRLMSFHFIPDCFKTQGTCIKAAEEDSWWLKDVPDKFKTWSILEFIPVNFKTQETYIKAVEENPWMLRCVPDHLKT